MSLSEPVSTSPAALPTEISVDFGPIVALVLDGLDSPHSKEMYARALQDFLAWLATSGRGRLDKAAVQAYRAELAGKGLAPSSINQKLSAIRKLATEAADNGLMDPALAAAVGRVKGVRSSGVRLGNWLPKDQAQELLGAPNASSLKGLRDRAILSALLGCGLRREEAASLSFVHVQQRDGRWVIVDLVGKGKRVRSVPMPSWAKLAIDQWARAAGISQGHVFRPVNKGGRVAGESVSPQAIADVVRLYAERIGVDLDAHDCRRTFAQLAHRGGSPLEQIQLSLGHRSIRTTEVYLGVQQDLTDAPCDHLGLRLEG